MEAMLKMLLKSFGVEIDPQQVISTVESMGAKVAEMAASQARTESMVKEIYNGRRNDK